MPGVDRSRGVLGDGRTARAPKRLFFRGSSATEKVADDDDDDDDDDDNDSGDAFW